MQSSPQLAGRLQTLGLSLGAWEWWAWQALGALAQRLIIALLAAGAMIAIAFVHNLLRRHPACTVLLHQPQPSAPVHADASAATREASSVADEQAAGQDPLPEQHVQSENQGGVRLGNGKGTVLDQSAGVCEADIRASADMSQQGVRAKAGDNIAHQEAHADNGHSSEQAASQHQQQVQQVPQSAHHDSICCLQPCLVLSLECHSQGRCET